MDRRYREMLECGNSIDGLPSPLRTFLTDSWFNILDILGWDDELEFAYIEPTAARLRFFCDYLPKLPDTLKTNRAVVYHLALALASEGEPELSCLESVYRKNLDLLQGRNKRMMAKFIGAAFNNFHSEDLMLLFLRRHRNKLTFDYAATVLNHMIYKPNESYDTASFRQNIKRFQSVYEELADCCSKDDMKQLCRYVGRREWIVPELLLNASFYFILLRLLKRHIQPMRRLLKEHKRLQNISPLKLAIKMCDQLPRSPDDTKALTA